ncbi:AAA family ATPase [Leifsonia sp. Root4]|uniref:DUF2075 domain-containing protein n=1 Tax=Leifsonia sp. Root4 TaxID=1736525 RepID=UPI0006F2D7C9|nr:DUF2075 domain-containing protein [Leifsonia sp. Root4]KQW06225.1 AAA family ATPase [Leifsonia sp. Root4]
MTPFDIAQFDFNRESVREWSSLDKRSSNWPVVYVLDNAKPNSRGRNDSRRGDVYVGESLNAVARMRQHLEGTEKAHLTTIRAIVDNTFNKSVCLDLESYLIRMLAGDGHYQVLNRNVGITDADYFDRARYQLRFQDVFEKLRNDGVFERTVPEIENSDLFKLSPFKALSYDQAIAVEDIIEGFFADLSSNTTSTTIVQGGPGTGKTVVAIYMLKLLVDVASEIHPADLDGDSLFSDFFVEENRNLLAGARVGFVIPQQALRKSIRKVFNRTPGLSADMVLTPFEVGLAKHDFDLLIVDESHRLNQRANQPSGVLNKAFRDITVDLFGADDKSKTQLDWILAKSKHQILMLDTAQSVRPADLPSEVFDSLVDTAKSTHRHYPLVSQMRVQAGADYVGYVRRLLGGSSPQSDVALAGRELFPAYDFRLFDSLAAMRETLLLREAEHGLARTVAGFAWEWKSKKDRLAFDIEVDGCQLRWNSTAVDWIASSNSLEEVGSIHTVQGYDLNYAGVIIGPDIYLDPIDGGVRVNRDSYFDIKGKENNAVLEKKYTDDDLLGFIRNIYTVLLTRGIRGTYVYVCDPGLREHLRQFIPVDDAEPAPRSFVE